MQCRWCKIEVLACSLIDIYINQVQLRYSKCDSIAIDQVFEIKQWVDTTLAFKRKGKIHRNQYNVAMVILYNSVLLSLLQGF